MAQGILIKGDEIIRCYKKPCIRSVSSKSIPMIFKKMERTLTIGISMTTLSDLLSLFLIIWSQS